MVDDADQAGSNAGPGWYPDPYRAAPLRWWDGTKWEAQVSGAPAMPAAPPVRYDSGRRPLPAQTPVYTTWIWLVVVLPLLGVVASLATIGTLTASFAALAHAGAANLALLTSPGYLLNGLLSWVLLAVSVVFSWLDYRTLERRGVDRPFHWAWSFLAWPVYTIGRGVIVRRIAGGRGSAVIWLSVVVLAISLAAGIAAALILSSAVLQTIHPVPTGA